MAQADFTRIATNIAALNSLNALRNVNNKLATSQVRLATGLRINEAADATEITTFTTAPAGSYEVGSKDAGTAASVSYTDSAHRSSAEDSQSVEITASPDTSAITGRIDSFLTKLNEVSNYLRAKTMVDPDTYARGNLANDSIFTWLRTDILNAIMASPAGLSTGAPQRLSDIGITFDEDMHASISDSSVLDAALGSNFADVAELFDAVMQELLEKIEPFTDDSVDGIIQSTVDSIDERMESIEERVDSLEALLDIKEARLKRQFGGMQALLARLSQQQLSLQLVLGGVSMGWW